MPMFPVNITKHRWLFCYSRIHLKQNSRFSQESIILNSHLCVTSYKMKGKSDSSTWQNKQEREKLAQKTRFFEQRAPWEKYIAVPTDERAPAPTPGMQLSWLQATKSSVSSMETFTPQPSAFWDPSNDDKIRVLHWGHMLSINHNLTYFIKHFDLFWLNAAVLLKGGRYVSWRLFCIF